MHITLLEYAKIMLLGYKYKLSIYFNWLYLTSVVLIINLCNVGNNSCYIMGTISLNVKLNQGAILKRKRPYTGRSVYGLWYFFNVGLFDGRRTNEGTGCRRLIQLGHQNRGGFRLGMQYD